MVSAFILSVTVLSPQHASQHAPSPTKTSPSATSPTGPPAIWHDPGAVEQLDFVGGVGGREGAPKPPFTFEEENLGGSNPKIRVKDSEGVKWSVKFGEEVKAETFSTRIAWAAGYFVDSDYFVAQGKVGDVGPLTRARHNVESDGSFHDARFERHREKGVLDFKDEHSWSWVQNPFLGTKELGGLKIVMMLVSNWDNKDVRDIKRGSNTAIYQYPNGEALYLVTDWGASMGKWGGYLGRSKWDCKGYQQQTAGFLKGIKDNTLAWGYSGQHTDDFRQGISINDLRWVMQYLSRITDDQLRAGLEASGAAREDNECFTKSIRARLDKLKACADAQADSLRSCQER